MPLIKETDYGTPAAKDRRDCFPDDRRLPGHRAGRHLDHRRRDGCAIQVPKLCATDSLEPFGSCRLCLVENPPAAPHAGILYHACCPGHGVSTQTERLKHLSAERHGAFISPTIRSTADLPANGDCELQDMAGAWGFGKCATALPAQPRRCGERRVQPLFQLDPAMHRLFALACVLRGSRAHSRTIEGRASTPKSRLVPPNFLDSECVSCGACSRRARQRP